MERGRQDQCSGLRHQFLKALEFGVAGLKHGRHSGLFFENEFGAVRQLVFVAAEGREIAS